MNRREFVGGTAALLGAGAQGGPASALPQEAAAPRGVVIDGLSPSALSDDYVRMLQEAGVTGWHKTMSELHSFAEAWGYLDENGSKVALVTRAGDIERAQREGKVGLMFGWQSASPLGDKSGQATYRGDSIPAHRTALRAYYQLGLRIVNLTYNTMNAFGAGCVEPHLGITNAGRRLVEEIHQLGILLDVGGHTGEQTSLDALEMSEGVPVICSHTNVAAICDNPRNTSDRVFEGIARSGGVIGVSAINDFVARNRRDRDVKVTPQADLDALLDHYVYLKRLVGADHIGIGADFTFGSVGGVDPDNVLFGREMASEQAPIYYVRGFESISELPNLVVGLERRGFNPEERAKVLGGNWLRVYRQVWG